MSSLTRLAMFLLLLLLSTTACSSPLPDVGEAASQPTRKLALTLGDQPSGQDADDRLLIAGGTRQAQTVDLQFELPLAADQRWVLWMARDPFELVRVTSLDGSIRTSQFFAPSADEGLIPAGYAFPLSRDAIGQQRLRLELQGAVRSAPTPHIMSEQDVLRQASREFALACAIYAALVTLLIASLVLYPAVRDPIFLLYSAYLAAALMFVATVSGHLYAWPVTGVLGVMGARGLWLMVLVFNAVALLTLTRFAETRTSGSAWIRGLDRMVMAMALLVLLPFLPVQAATDSLQAITTVAAVDASRHRGDARRRPSQRADGRSDGLGDGVAGCRRWGPRGHAACLAG